MLKKLLGSHSALTAAAQSKAFRGHAALCEASRRGRLWSALRVQKAQCLHSIRHLPCNKSWQRTKRAFPQRTQRFWPDIESELSSSLNLRILRTMWRPAYFSGLRRFLTISILSSLRSVPDLPSPSKNPNTRRAVSVESVCITNWFQPSPENLRAIYSTEPSVYSTAIVHRESSAWLKNLALHVYESPGSQFSSAAKRMWQNATAYGC